MWDLRTVGGAYLNVVHVGLYNFHSVLLNEGSNKAYALEVGGNLRLHVTQVVVQRSGAADPRDLILQVSRGHQQLCDSLLLQCSSIIILLLFIIIVIFLVLLFYIIILYYYYYHFTCNAH